MSRQVWCVVFSLALAGVVRAEQISLIADSDFQRGFEVLDPTPGALVVQGNLQWDASGGAPIWQLGQWDSQSTIFGVTPTQHPSGAWEYANADKQVIAGGGPGATESDLVLTINGQNEYGGTFRSISDPWPALLVQQSISEPGGHLGNQAPSIAEMASLNFQIEARLLFDNQITSGGYDSSIHASQYNIFYTVQNLNPASSGYGDFLWFGTALYDDRFDVTGKVVLVDGFTQKLIYSVGIEPFTSEKIADGNWMTIHGNLLPHIKAGLQEAWNRGILLDSQDLADYKIGGVNLGWEMPGLNNASLQIRNYSVTASLGVQLGDFNEDGSVGASDLTDPTGWYARYGADLNGSDFLDWQQNFAAIPAALAISVPEPATGWLMLTAGIGIIFRQGF